MGLLEVSECDITWVSCVIVSVLFSGKERNISEKCFLELSRGGVGRNGVKGISGCILFLLANDCY